MRMIPSLIHKFVKIIILIIITYMTLIIIHMIITRQQTQQQTTEHLQTMLPKQSRYLYPIHDEYCKNLNLDTAEQPQICCLNDNANCDYFRNCRCKDRGTGMCKKCWGDIVMYTQ